MLAILLFILVILLIPFLFQLWWTKVKSYWPKKSVPYMSPYPIFGNLTFIIRQNTFLWFRDIYQKFSEPYIGIWLLWKPALLINSADLARRILVTDFDVFRNRYLGAGEHDAIGKLNLVMLKDPQWSSIRKRMTPMFTAAKLRNLQYLMSNKAGELVQRIKKESEMNLLIDLRTLFSDFSTDVISIASFGVTSDATLTGHSTMRQITKDFMKFDFFRGLSWACVFFYPSLANIFKFTVFPKDSVDFLRKVFKTVVKQRESERKDESIKSNSDLLDALLKMKHDAAMDGENLSDDFLLAQAAIFLEAGFDTSGITLTHITYELAHSPESQEKLYKEIHEAKRRIGGAELDSTALSELSYLSCVIKEAMRKFPALGWLDRVALKDYPIDDKLTISKGTPVIINLSGIHYDPNYFPDPEKFDPDRFLPENEKDLKTCTFMPFGEGPRHCVGKRFAYQSMCYAISSIILNYEIRPLPNSVVPSKRNFEKKGMLLVPEKHHSVQFIPRKSV